MVKIELSNPLVVSPPQEEAAPIVGRSLPLEDPRFTGRRSYVADAGLPRRGLAAAVHRRTGRGRRRFTQRERRFRGSGGWFFTGDEGGWFFFFFFRGEEVNSL